MSDVLAGSRGLRGRRRAVLHQVAACVKLDHGNSSVDLGHGKRQRDGWDRSSWPFFGALILEFPVTEFLNVYSSTLAISDLPNGCLFHRRSRPGHPTSVWLVCATSEVSGYGTSLGDSSAESRRAALRRSWQDPRDGDHRFHRAGQPRVRRRPGMAQTVLLMLGVI